MKTRQPWTGHVTVRRRVCTEFCVEPPWKMALGRTKRRWDGSKNMASRETDSDSVSGYIGVGYFVN